MDVGTYSPSVMDDTHLLAWWLTLGQTGDLERCFGRQACALTEFFRGIQNSELYYLRDEQGWAAVLWADRLLAGAAIGLWVREDQRQAGGSLDFIRATIEALLERFPVLVFASRSAAVVRQAGALGFIPMGEVPYLFDGDACSLAFATRFTYEGAQQDDVQMLATQRPNGKDG